MTPLARNGAILAGVLVIGGGAAAVVIATMTAKPPPAAPVQMAPSQMAPSQAAPPQPAPAAGAPSFTAPPEAAAVPAAPSSGTDTAQNAPATPTVTFDPLVQKFTLVRDSAAYVAASAAAPQMYLLKAGTPLVSAARSHDGAWIVATTEDGQAAYMQAADLGPYDPSRAPTPDLPSHLSGTATVIDTADLMVDGQKVPLVGVVGETGDYVTALQKFINAQGGTVNCDLQGQAYLCTLPPSGIDIGRMGLFNGGADLGPDASADYQQQADAAKAAHKGIWR
jgi:hypothetical protein